MYWLITQEAVAPSRHDWKIVDWDVKPQHKHKQILNKLMLKLVMFMCVPSPGNYPLKQEFSIGTYWKLHRLAMCTNIAYWIYLC